ncbi:MAG: hypothetical protein J2P14_02285, partial [Acidothermales bacterium]|nr:hypothetical protein [Acidothermales bacterium]
MAASADRSGWWPFEPWSAGVPDGLSLPGFLWLGVFGFPVRFTRLPIKDPLASPLPPGSGVVVGSLDGAGLLGSGVVVDVPPPVAASSVADVGELTEVSVDVGPVVGDGTADAVEESPAPLLDEPLPLPSPPVEPLPEPDGLVCCVSPPEPLPLDGSGPVDEVDD